ncbi:MAG: hypothetical protein WC683_08095 [bacterium]
MTDTDRLAMALAAANGVIAILMDGLVDELDADALEQALELYRQWTARVEHILERYAHTRDGLN